MSIVMLESMPLQGISLTTFGITRVVTDSHPSVQGRLAVRREEGVAQNHGIERDFEVEGDEIACCLIEY
jgi:hypothetical protein